MCVSWRRTFDMKGNESDIIRRGQDMVKFEEPKGDREKKLTDETPDMNIRRKRVKKKERCVSDSVMDVARMDAHLVLPIRDAGGGVGLTDEELVESAPEDHLRMIEEAKQRLKALKDQEKKDLRPRGR